MIRVQTETPNQAISIRTTGGRGTSAPAKGWATAGGEELSFNFGEELPRPLATDGNGQLEIAVSPSDTVETAQISFASGQQVLHAAELAFEAPMCTLTQPTIPFPGEPTTMFATVRGLAQDAAGNPIAMPLSGHQLSITALALNPANLSSILFSIPPDDGGPPPPPSQPAKPGETRLVYRSDECGHFFGPRPQQPNPTKRPPPPPPPPDPNDPALFFPAFNGPVNVLGHLPFQVCVFPGAPDGPNPQFALGVTNQSVFLPDGSHPLFVSETKNDPVPPVPGTQSKPAPGPEPVPGPAGDGGVTVDEPAVNPAVGTPSYEMTTRERPKKDEGENPPPPPPQKPEPTGQDTKSDPVTLHSGEFHLNVTDLRVPGRGFDWEFTRTYKSRISYNGP